MRMDDISISDTVKQAELRYQHFIIYNVMNPTFVSNLLRNTLDSCLAEHVRMIL